MRYILLLLWASTALAGGIYTSPRMPDVLPNNGIFEQGSQTNPYVQRDAIGREIQAPHQDPGDGIRGYDLSPPQHYQAPQGGGWENPSRLFGD